VSDAVLVGAGTVRADDPRLTCRLPGGHDPIRIVLSGARSSLPRRARILAGGGPPTWVVVPAGTRAPRLATRGRGVEILQVAGRGRRVDFGALVRALGARGLTTLLIEGGGTVAAEALRARAVDRLVLFVAPMLLGGAGVAAIGPLGIDSPARALRVTSLAAGWIRRDLVLEGRMRYPRR
jgi:diaminohydroxyphosphoribosylaminopyrimidine deaminase/5-amino-6-(5-phosphoribosylamino)uracil reductase